MAEQPGPAGESGQESVYVVLDLQGVEMPRPGTQLLLQGMEGGAPVLQLADGTRLVGAFQETVGDQLFLATDNTQTPHGSLKVQLLGHSDKRITFSRQAAETQGGEEDGEGGGGGAAGRAGAAAAALAPS